MKKYFFSKNYNFSFQNSQKNSRVAFHYFSEDFVFYNFFIFNMILN